MAARAQAAARSVGPVPFLHLQRDISGKGNRKQVLGKLGVANNCQPDQLELQEATPWISPMRMEAAKRYGRRDRGSISTTEDNAAYLASWLQALRNDKRCIFTAATQVQAAADWLLSRMGAESEAPMEEAA